MSADPLRAAAGEGGASAVASSAPEVWSTACSATSRPGSGPTRCWCAAGARRSGAWPSRSPTTSAWSTSTATTSKRATAGRYPRSCPSTPGVLADPAGRRRRGARPPAARSCCAGLADLPLRPDLRRLQHPAMRLAAGGVPVYGRSVLISRAELADEMLAAMGDRPACILRGHGITVTGASVEEAVVRAVDLDELCRVTVQLAQLGVHGAGGARARPCRAARPRRRVQRPAPLAGPGRRARDAVMRRPPPICVLHGVRRGRCNRVQFGETDVTE